MQEFANNINLNALEEIDHQHVPYAVLLIKASQIWKDAHENQMPKTFAEKMQFQKETIMGMQCYPNGMNFEEAVSSYSEALKTNNLEFNL